MHCEKPFGSVRGETSVNFVRKFINTVWNK